MFKLLMKYLPGYKAGKQDADAVWQKKWDEANRVWQEQKNEEELRLEHARREGGRWGKELGEREGRRLERQRWMFDPVPTLTVTTPKQAEIAIPTRFDGYRTLKWDLLACDVVVDPHMMEMAEESPDRIENYFQTQMIHSLAKALFNSNAIRLSSEYDIMRAGRRFTATLFVAKPKD